MAWYLDGGPSYNCSMYEGRGGAQKWHEALYLHEYVFARFIALADTLGCMWDLFSFLRLSRFLVRSGVTPKASTDGGIDPEIP